MTGLLREPAAIRRSFESTPVKSATAVGQRVERVSVVTWCDARAVNRATEICGLFFRASSSASLIERVFIAPALDDGAKADLERAMQQFLPAAPLVWMIGLGADAVASELVSAADQTLVHDLGKP